MTPRRAFPNEVMTVYSDCGQFCVAIVVRTDGLFQGFEDQLLFDGEENVYYWSQISNGYTGLYDTAAAVARDVRNCPGFGGRYVDQSLVVSRVPLV